LDLWLWDLSSFNFCTTWLGSGLWALLVDIEGQ
jgi:hypothetical protein